MIKEPKCPDWKTPRSSFLREEYDRVRNRPVGEVLPSSIGRISYLKDRDNQLKQLFDLFESIGVPMGAENWAIRAAHRVNMLKMERDEIYRFLRNWNENKILEIDELEAGLMNAKKIYAKCFPAEIHCDYCGWGGARLIGNGNAACFDCLPE